jgi:hypothetical protein
MKRCLLALLVLLAGAVASTRADYVIIVANLGFLKQQPPMGGEGDPGMPPDNGGGIVPPTGTGIFGTVPPSGARGGPMPQPYPMYPPAGGGTGTGNYTGGFAGVIGTFPGRPMGEVPMGEMPGDPTGAMMNDQPYLVYAIVEVKNPISFQAIQLLTHPQYQQPMQISHKWGTSRVTNSSLLKVVPIQTPTAKKRFDAKNTKFQGARSNMQPAEQVEKLLENAEFALGHGLLKEFREVMADLAKTDARHPAAVAFTKYTADLEKPPAGDDGAELWQRKLLRDYRVTRKGHYALLHNYPKDNHPDVEARLNRLEETFQCFFYWFALKARPGLALPEVPKQRLLSVLVAQEEQFQRQHQIFDSAPMIADGFYARRDNLPVFSAHRLDPPYSALRERTKDYWLVWDRDQIIKSNQWMPTPTKDLPREQIYQQAPAMQTLALLQKALEEDAELATVSHEATRQLITATGLLPASVVAPRWIDFGIGSFFGTAKGSPWPTVGAPSATFNPHFNYLDQYKKAKAGKTTWKVDPPLAALKQVVTDGYFKQVAEVRASPEIPVSPAPEGQDPADMNGAKQKAAELKEAKVRAAEVKAHTLAWSLTFFLARENLEGLLRYYKELSRLPRDLEFDDEVLLTAFARAFNCIDTRSGKIDDLALQTLADKWSLYVSLTPLESEEIMKEVQKTSEMGTQTGGAAGGGFTPRP